MNIVQKAVWYVESHTRAPLSLETVANACFVSPFHLTRAFSATTGMSLMRYVRARRLSDAAHALAGGATDIFALALDAGYSSHEAFTRAFREHFGCTPESVRAERQLEHLRLQEIITVNTAADTQLAPPRVEDMPPRTLGGISERWDCDDPRGIPGQWQRFGPYIGTLPQQVGQVTYGVCCAFDDQNMFDYVCALELNSTRDLPPVFTTMNMPAQRYLAFAHSGHVSNIRHVIGAIWSSYLPSSPYKHQEGAAMLERYGPEFDGRTGMGGFEIWVPIVS